MLKYFIFTAISMTTLFIACLLLHYYYRQVMQDPFEQPLEGWMPQVLQSTSIELQQGAF